ncbi:hypothetical protein K1T71_012593 [Dendrolimus kikuchii]|uniref:Uncharacterized protein n=1 Tax=Dendrolimus kikuchii TaxID=765133 RepID=A0ACC1CJR8_9NEOP|nr:hypothetical protein K1T71_012593 [Dendrolimus kikuchii]
MWSKRVLIIFILCISNLFVFGKRFDTRCKLVRELIKVGIPNDIFLGQWVCLIEQVSQKDTGKLKESPSGKKFYGLFQIPARWCNEGKRRGICDVDCQALLDDDIHDDAVCANKIFKQEGFKFWSQWENRCKNNHHYTTEIYNRPLYVGARSFILRAKAVKMNSLPNSSLQKRRKQIFKISKRWGTHRVP